MNLHIGSALLLSALHLSAPVLIAQEAETEYAVVIRDMPLKCGPGPVYYQVGQVSQGEVVEVLRERFDWAKVRSNLAPLEGYLPAAGTSPGQEPDTILTNSRANILAPDAAGWSSSLFVLTAVDPGATLTVVERFREGGADYLRVIAPDTAGAWLPISALGPAEEAQIQAYRLAVTGLRGVPIEESGVEPVSTPPAGEQVDPVEVGGGTGAADPVEQPGDTETPIEPAEETPAGETEPVAPKRSPLEQQAQEAGVLTPAQLAELATVVLKEDIRTAEFDPALHEFDRTSEALTLGESHRKSLQIRRRTLELRQRVQRALLDAEGALAAAETESEALAQRVESLKGMGTHNLEGTLLPSNVYTGANLPKLYRLQSLATLSTRTRAYVEPGEVESIQRYLDEVVGVTGPVRFDEALQIFVITAEHIEVLKRPTGE
jgi:hypothetical protein